MEGSNRLQEVIQNSGFMNFDWDKAEAYPPDKLENNPKIQYEIIQSIPKYQLIQQDEIIQPIIENQLIQTIQKN